MKLHSGQAVGHGAISEAYPVPILEAVLAFHADNGGAFPHHTVKKLWQKALIEGGCAPTARGGRLSERRGGTVAEPDWKASAQERHSSSREDAKAKAKLFAQFQRGIA
jgi:hypothetical protein